MRVALEMRHVASAQARFQRELHHCLLMRRQLREKLLRLLTGALSVVE
jgi:hypothetical protein